jgi:hypothetical protein
MKDLIPFYLLTLLGVYFLPWIVAKIRRHRQSLAIGVLNLFAGWTLLGWIVAIVWACIQPIANEAPPYAAASPCQHHTRTRAGVCVDCGESIARNF